MRFFLFTSFTLRKTIAALFTIIRFYGFLIPALSFANSSGLINVVRVPDGTISLNGPSCKELTVQDTALQYWSRVLGEQLGIPSVATENLEGSRCTLDITPSVPSVVRWLQDFKTNYNGPNCWNSVLRVAHLISGFRFSSPEEMTFWMNSPYCHLLSENESSLPGDIIAIRDKDASEIHGMFFISEDLVFSKNTSSRMSRYGIQRANLVYQTFRLDELRCRKRQGPSLDCNRYSSHYRCHNVGLDRTDFENKNPTFSTLVRKTRELEAVISGYVMNGNGDFAKNQESIKAQLIEIENLVLNSMINSQKERFFLEALLLEINSLQIQIKLLGPKIKYLIDHSAP